MVTSFHYVDYSANVYDAQQVFDADGQAIELPDGRRAVWLRHIQQCQLAKIGDDLFEHRADALTAAAAKEQNTANRAMLRAIELLAEATAENKQPIGGPIGGPH